VLVQVVVAEMIQLTLYFNPPYLACISSIYIIVFIDVFVTTLTVAGSYTAYMFDIQEG